jgi:phosphoglycolate phosphatase
MHPATSTAFDPSSIRTVVFDLDGTLVDSAPEVANILRIMLTERGLPSAATNEIRRWSSIGGAEMIKAIFACQDKEVAQLLGEFRERYYSRPTDPSSLYPGVVGTLTTLRERGLALAICTNKPGGLAKKVLRELELEDIFDAAIYGDSLSVKKPHSLPILEAIRMAGGTKVDSLMVGDSTVDQRAASAACIPFCFFALGYNDGVERESAHLTISDLSEILYALPARPKKPHSHSALEAFRKN